MWAGVRPFSAPSTLCLFSCFSRVRGFVFFRVVFFLLLQERNKGTTFFLGERKKRRCEKRQKGWRGGRALSIFSCFFIYHLFLCLFFRICLIDLCNAILFARLPLLQNTYQDIFCVIFLRAFQ